MTGLEKILLAHPLFAGLETELGTLVAGCTRNLRLETDRLLFREGEAADEFFLIREGRVAFEVHAPDRPVSMFLTVTGGEMAGLSWLVPPYRWAFDARALTDVRALGVDARCLRAKCDADPKLGYEVMKRVSAVLLTRLHTTRLQALDIYRRPGS